MNSENLKSTAHFIFENMELHDGLFDFRQIVVHLLGPGLGLA